MRRDWFVHVYERIYICAQLQPSLLTKDRRKGHVYNQKGHKRLQQLPVLINKCLPMKYSNEN